jgi:branched-chain amino acid transport system permease protein
VTQILVSGLLFGVVYALVALGFSLAYRMTRVLNFAQGDLLTVGGFLGYGFFVGLGWPFLPTLVASSALVGLLMVVYYRLALEPAVQRNVVAATVSTIGLSFALENLIQIIWGPYGLAFPSVFGADAVTILGVRIVPEMVVLCVVGILAMLVLTYFMARTRLGVSMRAVAGEPVMARLVGVNVSRTNMMSFFICGALAGVAGVLLAPITSLTAGLGLTLSLKGIVAALIGGLGSLPGAVVGGLLLGLSETLFATYLDPSWRDSLVYVAVIIVLLFRPYGIFGEEGTEEGR